MQERTCWATGEGSYTGSLRRLEVPQAQQQAVSLEALLFWTHVVEAPDAWKDAGCGGRSRLLKTIMRECKSQGLKLERSEPLSIIWVVASLALATVAGVNELSVHERFGCREASVLVVATYHRRLKVRLAAPKFAIVVFRGPH